MTARLLQSAPFFLAALYCVMSPIFTALTAKAITDQLVGGFRTWSGDRDVPLHLDPKLIARLSDWTADAPQVVPTLLLPTAGLIFSVGSPPFAALVLAGSALLLPAATLWVYSMHPLDYRQIRCGRVTFGSKHWQGLTLVPFVGAILNAAAGVAVLMTQ